MAKCDKCGSTRISLTMWTGARCGGSRVKCEDCGNIIEERRYEASDEPNPFLE